MIKFITSHSVTQHIFCYHSKLELLKNAKTKFASCYLAFRRLLKVREALGSMVSSDSWQCLKDRVAFAFDRHEF
jgi:hypothetical protein